MALRNVPVGFINENAVSLREGEIGGTPFDGAANYAAMSTGIGVNVGDYSPKPSDWSEETRDPGKSMHIGGDGYEAGTPAFLSEEPLLVFNNGIQSPVGEFGFLQADGDIAPGTPINAGSSVPYVNGTGVTVPQGSWLWGGYILI